MTPTQNDKEELSTLNRLIKRMWHWCQERAHATVSSSQTIYLCLAVIALLASTVFWAVLGARLQLHNADQLVDPYMFSSGNTFHGAAFPSAHTFLMKWPIFWLLGVVGVSSASLMVATVGVVLVTVSSLAFVLYKINRRPLVLGTLYFALAFVLLLVPAQPYVGGVLPVNMAMVTTRNLEYILYIASLVLFVRARTLRSVSFWSGVVLMAVLVASDKLFMGLALGGAGLSLVAYALFGNWRMVSQAVRWLVGAVIATVGAAVLLLIISKLHLAHLVGESGTSPYGMSSEVKDLVLGIGYGLLGLLTNFGANPAYENRTLGTLPHDVITHVLTASGLLHLLALALLCLGIIAVWRVVRPLLSKASDQTQDPSIAVDLSQALIWSTVAACAIFVATQHYYAVDARYLSIGLFAVFISAATAFRSFQPMYTIRAVVMGVAMVGILAGSALSAHTISVQQNAAFNEISSRNITIVQMLKRHKVDVLVGDYWRVLPIKLAADGNLNTMPLAGCTAPNTVLTSDAWRPDLKKHSFAYLISFDGGNLTNYPRCTLPQISAAHGRPNAVQVISGTLAAPKEALLFYDQGSHPSVANPLVPAATAPPLPVNADQLTKKNCSQPTIMNVVAHEDDDLLFMSPDLQHDLHAGNCIRTVYTTAGDSGFGKYYWLIRELGAEAAYSTMLGIQNIWDQQILQLPTGQYVTVATPRESSKVSLIFLNLPDGNIHGDGFPDSGHESLGRLQSGAISQIHAMDKQSVYTSEQLTLALMSLMDTYQPAEIRTQANVPSSQYPDHSDHIATGIFADAAAQEYDRQHFGGAVTIPVKRYIGYPIHAYDVNVSEEDLDLKRQAFFAYAQYDKGVCGSIAQCARTPTYDAYLSRQYQDR